jgi:DNA-binding MarR family transcriptional regulator
MQKEADLPYDLIELLFFAYRDFTGDPDGVLAEYEFGRAHHRVLHFVERNPGIMVTDLLAILRITKQSLGRVLKQLVDAGIIEQREGRHDRRQRLLYTTERGHALAVDLALMQQKRLERALIGLPDGSQEIVRKFLLQMIDPEMRPEILELIRSPFDLEE